MPLSSDSAYSKNKIAIAVALKSLGYKSTHTHNGSAYYVVLLMNFSTKVFSKGVTNETNPMNINNLQQ